MFEELKKDKLVLGLLIVIIILGLFIRLYNYSELSYTGDDESTIPVGLLFFYPHNYFIGLSGVSEPPLGNIIIGAGCMLSGQDFSKVSQVQPSFYPGRELLIGPQLEAAQNYCHSSMFLFGILFFLAITVLAFLILNKYSALYVASFFAFFPYLLRYSRFIHTDIIYMTFTVIGLIFLYLFYISEKSSKKEKIFSILSFSFFGLSLATKFPGGAFIILAGIIFLLKYRNEIKEFSHERIMPAINLSIMSFIAFLFFFLLPFNLNIKNARDAFVGYSNIYGEVSGIVFGKMFFQNIYEFILHINPFDTFLLVISLYVLYRLIKNKERTKAEKFILYLVAFFLIFNFFFLALKLLRVMIPFAIGIIFLMSLVFSEKYCFIKKHHRTICLSFLIVYVIFSFATALDNQPYFMNKNPLVCIVNEKDCFYANELLSYSAKPLAKYLESVMEETDAFIPITPTTIVYYTREGDSLYNLQFNSQFESFFKRQADLQDYIQYYHPNNQTLRFVMMHPYNIPEKPGFYELYTKYNPTKVISLQGKDAIWVYDLKNLTEK
ncbi:MAG: phospholipid carrier-dependent glycosyltransferase [Candidatus Nanoarchaeia archaeon]|nr:phospholipid carrier-dependent glycosyltransferase [Candidatus Nanoarchaeia archaeon]